MDNKERKHYTPEEEVSILRRVARARRAKLKPWRPGQKRPQLL